MIEGLIRKALLQSQTLQANLARFDGEAAIFYQMAPPDKAVGWGPIQYPRVDFTADWTYNPERKAEGSAQINVWCLNNGTGKGPEEIGEIIRDVLRDLFLTDEGGEVYALEWQRTDLFDAGGSGNEPLHIGVTLSFDLLAFPVQATTEPDPIEGLSDELKALRPEAWIVGVDTMPELCRPTADKAVIYARLTSDGSSMKNSYAVAWMDVGMSIHIFAPEPTARQTICREISNAMALDGEVRLRDGSPMLLKRIAITPSANPLRQGQMRIDGRYGVLRREPFNPIQHIHTNLEVQH